jgi:hypothetical protein
MYIQTYIHTYIYIYIYISIYLYIYLYIHTYINICTHTQVLPIVTTPLNQVDCLTEKHVYTYIHTHIHTYMYTRTGPTYRNSTPQSRWLPHWKACTRYFGLRVLGIWLLVQKVRLCLIYGACRRGCMTVATYPIRSRYYLTYAVYTCFRGAEQGCVVL